MKPPITETERSERIRAGGGARRGGQHLLAEGQKPLDVAIRVDATVGAGIRLVRAGKPQVNRTSGQYRKP
jgi:hypothetical protein